jgi:Zn-dependent protease with chaperone function
LHQLVEIIFLLLHLALHHLVHRNNIHLFVLALHLLPLVLLLFALYAGGMFLAISANLALLLLPLFILVFAIQSLFASLQGVASSIFTGAVYCDLLDENPNVAFKAPSKPVPRRESRDAEFSQPWLKK